MHWHCEDNDQICSSYLSESLCDEMFRSCEDNSTLHLSNKHLRWKSAFWTTSLPKHVTHADANTPQPFPGSRHKKTWFLPCNVVLLWIRSVLMPLLLFLTAVSWRWTWPMPFRGLIQFSNMSQSWFFRQKLTQASVKFTNLQSRTQTQNEICKINPSKIFPCKCKVSSLETKNKISKSSRNITNGLKLCQGRTVSHAFKPVSVATPRRNLHTHI